MQGDGREFPIGEAFRHVEDFCRKNPKWQPIYRCREPDYAPIPWEQLPERDRVAWSHGNSHGSESFYYEFCTRKPYPYRYGHVSGEGVFYGDCCQIPFGHNSCMVIQVGGKKGRYYFGGRGVRSGQRKRS